MLDLATITNISEFFQTHIMDHLSDWLSLLVGGDLYGFESRLSDQLTASYNFISEQLLTQGAEQVLDKLSEEAKQAGHKGLRSRDLPLRIGTGHCIEVPSIYISRPIEGWTGSRHLTGNYWGLIQGGSLSLHDRVGYCAVLGPSYDVAQQTLSKFGVSACTSSVRDITNRLAAHCHEFGEERLMLKAEESLAGKRVVVSTDGGRTRTRIYDGAYNDNEYLTYQTKWREIKLFVIDILDEQGRPHRHELPIYGCRFSDQDLLDLLARYLKALEVDQAEHVQIIADGAPWIWNNVKTILMDLGVDPERITETLDHYHASGYVHDLLEQMPKRIDEKQRKAYQKQFKDWLWQGRADEIVKVCREVFKRPGKIIKRWLNYLDKHQPKMQYADLQTQKLMCGSGIVESGVRRINNLRFKNASTFWDQKIVEKLYFLRAAVLSHRWDIVMSNLNNSS